MFTVKIFSISVAGDQEKHLQEFLVLLWLYTSLYDDRKAEAKWEISDKFGAGPFPERGG